MKGITVIKSYQRLTTSLKNETDLPYDSDRAVADFRAFHPIAAIHAARVTNPLAIDVMLEIVSMLQKDLIAKHSTQERQVSSPAIP